MQKDLVTGLLGTIFSAFYLYETAQVKIFGGAATAGANAQTVPKIWGICFLALSLILVLRSLLHMRKEQNHKTLHEIMGSIRNKREVIYTFVLLILYAALMKPIGFVLASILYIYFQIWTLTPLHKRTQKLKKVALLLAILFSIGLYYIFTRYFMVMLPEGILPF